MIQLQFSNKTGGLHPGVWAIRLATWSWASHVDFVLPDGRLLGARPGGGVNLLLHRDADYGRIERFSVNTDHAGLIIAHARAQTGKPYDWLALIGHVVRRDWQRTDSWFCSELIAWAFEQAGDPLFRQKKHHRITPRDLLLSGRLQRI